MAESRAAKMQALLEKSQDRASAQTALRDKLQLKIWLEALKLKTRRAREAEEAKRPPGEADARRPAGDEAEEAQRPAGGEADEALPPRSGAPPRIEAEPPEKDAPAVDASMACAYAESLVHDFGSLVHGAASSPVDKRSAARAAATTLRRHGVCHVIGACDGGADGASKAAVLQACLSASEERVALLLGHVAAQGLESRGLKTKEIVCRNYGRYDVPLDDANVAALARTGAWLQITRRVLGLDSYLLKCGLVYAEPGAAQQTVHADGKHLFADDSHDGDSRGAGDRHLAAHCITVFVPLVDMCLAIGPTQFFPGTHRNDSDLVAAMRGSAPSASFETAKAGDCILFDSRVRHRGLANSTAEARPLLYFTYARSWFRDATNYSNLSLFDAETIHRPASIFEAD